MGKNKITQKQGKGFNIFTQVVQLSNMVNHNM